MSKSRILLNPRDIDINMVNKSCNSWSSPYQLSYAIGVGDLVATSLNTFSTFMAVSYTHLLLTEAELDDIFSVQNLMHPAYKANRYTDESEQ